MGKVMVIDDNVEFRKKCRKMFKDLGLEVVEAPDALETSNLLLREMSDIDLILLDLQIAEVDGRDIYDIIREYTTSIPILVCSVLPLSEQKLRVPHVRDYFNKAEGEEVLRSKVKTLLNL